MELVFKLSITSFKWEYVQQIIIFTLSYALFAFILIRFLPRKAFKIVTMTLVVLLTLLYFTQDIYYRILSGFFSFDIAGDAHKATAFVSRIFVNLTYVHLLYLLPIVLVIYFAIRLRHIKIPKRYFFYRSTSDFLQLIIIAGLLFTTVVHTLPKKPENYVESPYIYAEYDYYMNVPSAYQTINKFGMITYFQRDLANKFKEEPNYLTVFDEIQDYGKERVKHEHNPFYDSYFEDKNFILIMAESFDTFAIDPLLTPNIYEMQQNSWNFTNYYSPLYYRNTADTEFMSQTGFYTSRNTPLTMEAFQDNYFPYTLPRIFTNQGYGAYSFHNYTDYFYPRSEFHPNTLGYDEYYDAVDFEMLSEPRGVITNHIWQSDLELMDQSLDILLEKPRPFFSYILTVSGHMDYEESHPIASKNYQTIVDLLEANDRELPDDEFIYYHAANYELDLAIGLLMDRLENEGIADDTVIMLFGDHYAYGIDKDDIALYDQNDLDKGDENSPLGELRFQKVPMMIYNPNLYPKNFERVFASIDIMPTIANLFGLNVDYEYLFGKDIFSNQRRAVYFSNGSILTEEFFFDSENEDFYYFSEETETYELFVLDPEAEDYEETLERYSEIEAFYGEYLYRQMINESILDINYFWLKAVLERD
jgi:phosphoglycerol transferase MdoB-like AlkP superfamily enzyme